MTNPKCTDLELQLKAIELAFALDDLLEESAREGAAQIEAMNEDEIELLLSHRESDESRENRESLVSAATWRGSLMALTPLRAVASAALAEGPTGAGHRGVKADLAAIIGDQAERDDLAWVAGPLRIEAAYSDQKTIESLRVSVGRRKPARSEGRPLVVKLADQAGGYEVIRLKVDVPSVTLPRPSLSGAFADLELTVSLARNRPV